MQKKPTIGVIAHTLFLDAIMLLVNTRIKFLLAALFITFLFFTRLFLLKHIPVTLTHDETVYAIQAYSYVVQGKTIDQAQSMWTPIPIDAMYAEYPALFISPGFLFTPNALLATHIIPAIFGIAFPFIFGYFVYGIWKNTKLSIIAAILSVFNPLLWQMSRLSYDAFFSAFFYVAGGAILVNCKAHKKLWSIPLLTFGFFQYQGFKPLLIPWVVLVVLMKFVSLSNNPIKEIKKYLKIKRLIANPTIIVILFSFILTTFYALIMLPSQSSNNRLGKIIFTDITYLSTTVDKERGLSLVSPFTSLNSNKISVMTNFIAKRLIGSFNPELLFLNAEPAVSGFFVWTHGLFYWAEGLGIIVGLYLIFTTRKRLLLGIIMLMGIVLLDFPNLVNTVSEWYTLRGLLSYLFILIIASIGLYKLWGLKYLRIVILLFYLLNVFGFAYQYYFRYPIVSADAGNIEERILARYIYLSHKKDPNKEIYVYGNEPHYIFYNYLLYSHVLNETNATDIARTIQANKDNKIKQFVLNGISFSDNCVPKDSSGIIIKSVHSSDCDDSSEKTDEIINDTSNSLNERYLKFENTQNALSISQVKDSGLRYSIYRDTLCSKENLSNFLQISSINQFKIEKLTAREFCKNWITKQY